MQIKEVLQTLEENSKSETPVLDAQVLCCKLLNCTKSFLFAHPEHELTSIQQIRLQEMQKALQDKILLPYILGEWEFFGKSFCVSPDTLIPRPETEELVEYALKWLANHPDANRVIDIGTGSGCIAISLALHCKRLRLKAVDISEQALAIARNNANRYMIANQIEFIKQDLLTKDTGQYDLLCANLPYIPTDILKNLEVAKHEPWIALDGGEDGLFLIEKLLRQAKNHLSADFLMLFEIEYRQGQMVLSLAKTHYPDAQVSILKDLSSNDRFVVIKS